MSRSLAPKALASYVHHDLAPRDTESRYRVLSVTTRRQPGSRATLEGRMEGNPGDPRLPLAEQGAGVRSLQPEKVGVPGRSRSGSDSQAARRGIVPSLVDSAAEQVPRVNVLPGRQLVKA